jgi:two-component SAPR family response regulator
LQLLIVDDDAVQRMLIAAAAKQAGHAVTLAQSCSEAITQIQAARFDCVTLDLMLGDFEPEDFASGHGLRLKMQFQLVPLHRKRNVSLQDSFFPNMPVHRSFKETRCEPARQRPTTNLSQSSSAEAGCVPPDKTIVNSSPPSRARNAPSQASVNLRPISLRKLSPVE